MVCVLERMSVSGTLLLTAEITSPAGLRAVLHHGDSWNNDVTFEPQPASHQMVDVLIKYLSAPGNYPHIFLYKWFLIIRIDDT